MSSFDVKAWKASEGLKRAEMIVSGLAEDGAANNNIIGPILQHRMREVIGRAIDQALTDGSEMDALASVVGNGHGLKEMPGESYASPENGLSGKYEVTEVRSEPTYKIADAPKKKRGRPPGRPKKAKPAQEAAP